MHVNFYFSNTKICQKTSVGRQLPAALSQFSFFGIEETIFSGGQVKNTEAVVLAGDEKNSSPCMKCLQKGYCMGFVGVINQQTNKPILGTYDILP